MSVNRVALTGYGAGLRRVTAFLVFLASTAQASDTLKLVHFGSVTGHKGALTAESRNGAAMAIEEINARGGVKIAGDSWKLELVPLLEDRPDSVSEDARKWIQMDRVAALIGFSSASPAIAAAKVAEGSKTPVVTSGGIAQRFTQQRLRNAFSVGSSIESVAAGTVYLAAPEKKRSSIIATDRRVDTDSLSGMKAAIASNAFTLQGDLVGLVGADVENLSRRLKDKHAEIVFYQGNVENAQSLLSAIREVDANTRVYVATDLCRGVSAAGRVADKVVCASPWLQPQQMPKGAEWRKKYREQFRTEPDGVGAYSYDAVYLIVEAMRNARAYSGDSLLEAIRKSEYQGVTGRIVFNPNGSPRTPAMRVTSFRANPSGPASEETSGPTCPNPCPRPSGQDGPAQEDAPSVPAGCCGVPKPQG